MILYFKGWYFIFIPQQLLIAYEHKERFYCIWDTITRPQVEAAQDE